ncbi:MAG: PIN domain-containing protein [Deltaproteobacteria bacterium]|nr:PIN domain-containing protein [Deltaproteobacteria bacterium]
MRVVVDTNVLISAVFRDRLPEDVIVFLVGSPDIDWIATEKIVQEYGEVLRRKKFGLAEAVIQKWEKMQGEAGRWKKSNFLNGRALCLKGHGLSGPLRASRFIPLFAGFYVFGRRI